MSHGPIAAALALLSLSPSATTAQPANLVSPAAYYRPVIVDGRTYPVARASWLSLIEFSDDWHAPRMRLVGGRWQQVGVHEGHDITAEPGTPVLSMTPGRVENLGWTFYSGNRVGIRGEDGSYYFYAHLSRYAEGLSTGDPVEAGTPIGEVGNTGYGPPGHEDEFPPHLHLGIQRPNGEWVNPFPIAGRLYRRSVRSTTRGEERLQEAVQRGDRRAFEQLSGELYLSPEEYHRGAEG